MIIKWYEEGTNWQPLKCDGHLICILAKPKIWTINYFVSKIKIYCKNEDLIITLTAIPENKPIEMWIQLPKKVNEELTNNWSSRWYICHNGFCSEKVCFSLIYSYKV